MNPSDPESNRTPPAAAFATTRWTVVLAAGRADSPESSAALETLCRTYWYPLYAFARRQGHAPPDAEDLTQSFFASFLEKNYLEGLSSERGRFRAFLLACFKHFLANEWDRAGRLKRGGDREFISLDAQSAEMRYLEEPADHLSPDRLYDREWALALLNLVLARLRAEVRAEGHEAQFDRMKVFLTLGKGARPYAAVGAEMGLTENAVKVAVHRLRRRYRELLREEIAQTLVRPEQVQEEIHALFGAFAS